MEFWLTKLGGALLLPPLNFYLLALLGLALAQRWRRGGWALVAASLACLWLLSTPLIGSGLRAWIEPDPPPGLDRLRQARAIVVLGGGTYFDAPEYGADTAGTFTLERLRWAARLQRETGLPVMVTGGAPFGGDGSTEAAQMKEALERDFRVPVRWTEDRSTNTLQSATYAHDILDREGVMRIALVTHASHMRRARRAFISAGFEVLDAPTGFATADPLTVLSFLPSAHGLLQTRIFCHEALGIGWYHVRRLFARND